MSGLSISPTFTRRHRLVVDVEHAFPHLDAVAGQADHPLDVVERRVGGNLKTATSPRSGGNPDAAGEDVRAERQRIARIAVCPFRHEEIIAFEQGRATSSDRIENGWKNSVRMTRASSSAWTMTLTVSPSPPDFSRFVCHAHVVLDYASMGIRGEAIWGNHNADSGKPRAAYRYGTASMMTNACAIGNSSVMVRWITAR